MLALIKKSLLFLLSNGMKPETCKRIYA